MRHRFEFAARLGKRGALTPCRRSLWALIVLTSLFAVPALAAEAGQPNILLAIADDQSFAYTSAAGCMAVSTPAFDRVAREGVLFRNGFVAPPGAVRPAPPC